MLDALPGLIKTDQAYDKISSVSRATEPSALSEVKDLLIGPQGAVVDIQTARETAGKDHPVQVYLIQAQLAAYRNYMVALDRLQNHATVPANDPARIAANAQIVELKRLVLLLKQGQEGQNMIAYWVELCALDEPR